jgi:hypothetical protein
VVEQRLLDVVTLVEANVRGGLVGAQLRNSDFGVVSHHFQVMPSPIEYLPCVSGCVPPKWKPIPGRDTLHSNIPIFQYSTIPNSIIPTDPGSRDFRVLVGSAAMPRSWNHRLYRQVLLSAAASVVAAWGFGVRAELLFYDGFDYVVGERLGDASSGGDWDNAKSNITIAEGSLSYGGLQESVGNRVRVDGGDSNLDGTRTITDAWAVQTSGALYISFLLRVDSVGGIATSGDGTPIVNISQAGA